MKQTLFNNPDIGNPSTAKYIILGVLIGTAFVFIGWVLSTLGEVADVMIEMV